jgi:hypothetical protein
VGAPARKGGALALGRRWRGDIVRRRIDLDLRRDLVGGAEGEFADLLARRGVSPERLVSSFFRALAPYPRITSDILEMFENAAARRSDENLRVFINFNEMDSPIQFDLEAAMAAFAKSWRREN